MDKKEMPGKLSDNAGQEENLNNNTKFEFESQKVLKCFPLYDTYNTPRPAKKISLAGFIQMAKNPTIGPKDKAQAITPYLSNAKTNNAAYVAEYYAILVDHDKDNLTADGIRAIYDPYDIAYFIFTTSSHEQPGKGRRFKVMIPLSCSIRHDDWMKISRGFALKMKADLTQARTCQFFYAPNKLTADAPYQFIDETNRSFLNGNEIFHPFIADALEAYETEEKRLDDIAKAATPKPRANNCPAWGNSIIEKVNNSRDMGDVLLKHRYARKGKKKYLSPGSESGNPGVTILQGNRCYSHHGTGDPLSNLNHAGKSLDVFDCLCILNYGGDVTRAVRELAGKVDPEGQKERQRDFMKEQERKAKEQEENSQAKDFSMINFSMKGRSDDMRQQMEDEVFVLGMLAILGQSTIFYGKPNAGKTLLIIWLLTQAIKAEIINGDDVFYINADDSYRGLVYKLMIAEKYNFHMLAPGHSGQPGEPVFKSADLPVYLSKMIENKTAPGKILILDTVKKFTDLMSKTTSSKFGEVIRQFISHGGTVIMLAHANKHRDEEKKIVYSGTTDLVDDADCAFMLDIIQDDADGLRTVKFENFKSRGDVTLEAFYKYDYQSGTTYFDRLDSVTPIDLNERNEILNRQKMDATYNKNKIAIDVILECINERINQKTKLIEESAKRSEISKAKIRKALLEHTGTDKTKNQFWYEKKEINNTSTYHTNYGTAHGK